MRIRTASNESDLLVVGDHGFGGIREAWSFGVLGFEVGGSCDGRSSCRAVRLLYRPLSESPASMFLRVATIQIIGFKVKWCEIFALFCRSLKPQLPSMLICALLLVYVAQNE